MGSRTSDEMVGGQSDKGEALGNVLDQTAKANHQCMAIRLCAAQHGRHKE